MDYLILRNEIWINLSVTKKINKEKSHTDIILRENTPQTFQEELIYSKIKTIYTLMYMPP